MKKLYKSLITDISGLKINFSTACLFLFQLVVFGKIANYQVLADKDDPLVRKVQNGEIRGRQSITSGLNKTYYVFQGIPYAEPPTGNLRFKPPIPASNWDGILNATQDLVACVQIFGDSVVGSEDCLYLNVFIPAQPRSHNSPKLLPVMVWIYGGSYIEGTANYYAPDYFLDQNVIVVTLNYRLGIFGFLSTGDLVSPGNYGLKDQLLALKWVQANIASFGGDPQQVTLFGESAGSVATSLHLLSPKSTGLFQKAIMQSGTSVCQFSLSTTGKQGAFEIGAILGLNTTSTQTLVDGLRKADYIELQNISISIYHKIFNDQSHTYVFAPVIEPKHDDAFMTDASYPLVAAGQFNQVPAIIGFNSLEGYFDSRDSLQLYFAGYDEDYTRLVPNDMNINNSVTKESIGLKIKTHYFGTGLISSQVNQSFEFATDDVFLRPIRETVCLQSKYASVYFYRFSYRGVLGGIDNDQIYGVPHAGELHYLWAFEKTASAADELIRTRMVKMWTNFAKYSNPTPVSDAIFDNLTWTVASTKNKDGQLWFIDIDTELTMKINPHNESLQMWNDLYKEYGNPPYDTY